MSLLGRRDGIETPEACNLPRSYPTAHPVRESEGQGACRLSEKLLVQYLSKEAQRLIGGPGTANLLLRNPVFGWILVMAMANLIQLENREASQNRISDRSIS